MDEKELSYRHRRETRKQEKHFSRKMQGLIHHVIKKDIQEEGMKQKICFNWEQSVCSRQLKKFDTEYGVCFSTYAVPMIAGEVRRFMRDDGMVKVSRGIKGEYMEAQPH